LAQKGIYDKAIPGYDAVLKLDPKNAFAYKNRADAYAATGQVDRAIADYGASVRLNPELVEVYHRRGWLWMAKNDFARAIADFNEALRRDPEYAAGYKGRGAAFSQTGEYAKAKADLVKAVQLDRKDAEAINQLAWYLATCPDEELRHGENAKRAAKIACDMTEWNKGEYIDTYAAALAESGDFDAAVKWQTKAVALADPQHKEAIAARLELFRQKRPYREGPKKP